jgi:hypothetical protein
MAHDEGLLYEVHFVGKIPYLLVLRHKIKFQQMTGKLFLETEQQ